MHIPVAMCVGDTLNSLRCGFAECYGGRYALNGEDLKLLPGFFALCLFLVALLLLLLSLRFALCNLPLEVPNKEAGNGAGDAEREDEGTVVGAVASSNEVRSEQVGSAGGVKAVPAVRAMAKKLKVDLARVAPTGAGCERVKSDSLARTRQLSPMRATFSAVGLGGR